MVLTSGVFLFAVNQIINIVSFFTTFYFYSSFLEKRWQGKRNTKTLLVALLFNLVLIMANRLDKNWINVIVSFLLTLLIAVVLFKESLLTKLIFSLMFHSLAVLTDLMVFFFISFIDGSLNENLRYLSVIYVVGHILHMVILLLVVGIISKVFRKKRISGIGNYFISRKFLVPLLLSSLLSTFIVQAIYDVQADGNLSHSALLSNLVALMFILAASIGSFFVSYALISDEVLRQERETIRSHEKLYATQIHAIESKNSLIHDFKSNLLLLLALFEGKDPNAKRLTRELVEEYGKAIVEQPLELNNIALTVLLTELTEECSRKGIDLTVDVLYHDFSFLKLSDTSTIFGNLFGNAIAAVESLPTENRIIKLACHRIQSYILIELSNTYDKDSIKYSTSGRLLTSKREHLQEGFGVKNILKTAKRYHGGRLLSRGR